MNTPRYHEAVGAVHLHSSFSDGTLTIPEIAAIASEKQLDFLMFSDHNTLESKHLGMEGWYKDVLVLIGTELNDPDDRNHYLAFQIDEDIPLGLTAQQYVRRVRDLGGFGIIAHPAEKRNFSDAYPPYPWTEWDINEYDSIEIWNQLSEWIEGLTKRNVLWRMMHPLRSIRYPVWETLERWDRANLKRKVVGVGGIDVHGFRIKMLGFIPIQIYPYKVQFKSIRMHFLLKESLKTDQVTVPFEPAKESIYEALHYGRCFISNFSVGDARGFKFYAETKGGAQSMGSRFPMEGDMILKVSTPLKGAIRLLCNGKELKRETSQGFHYRADLPGVYRIEVFRKRRGWIYSNPIVITN